MQYQIPAGVLPGTKPKQAVQPYAIFFVMMICGAGIGCLWAARNARIMGCPDWKQQRQVLGMFWAGIVAMAMIGLWCQLNFAPEHIGHLVGDIIKSATITGAFVVGA